MALIEFEDKENLRVSELPRKNKVTAEDLNEIKSVVNSNMSNFVWTVDLMEEFSINVFAPSKMKIKSVDVVTGSQSSFSIKVNDSSYTLGDQIEKGDKISVSNGSAIVVNLMNESND